ncbi:hypothetical protein FSP39_015084 [Pinctada imbricata]|uniref:MIT domain-containing protein n=1 Tax=Pinctada imbricata TaxID=66713 RepID=A0AA88Y8N8_PINIB|nr:hypothetical protein FSP39_015084 [Pinctada imbricata]
MTDPTKLAGVESSAINILKRAVELDQGRRFEEAVVCYQEGLQLLLDVMKGTPDKVKKEKYRDKIQEYMGRAEQLKEHVKVSKSEGKVHEQIQIDNDATGYSYSVIFSRFLDQFLTCIEIEDPYIRSTHQIYNLLRFCELVVKSAAPVTEIKLTTGRDDSADGQRQQQNKLRNLKTSLANHNVTLHVEYNDDLHDREIRFNNGWIVKIGRGLDMYKATENNFCIGFCDFDLRKCHKTTVDIFHKDYVSSASDSVT